MQKTIDNLVRLGVAATLALSLNQNLDAQNKKNTTASNSIPASVKQKFNDPEVGPYVSIKACTKNGNTYYVVEDSYVTGSRGSYFIKYNKWYFDRNGKYLGDEHISDVPSEVTKPPVNDLKDCTERLARAIGN